MTEKRKLQVFVSSTFIDLKEERQAAVQAILTAGHIPAGMELFSAGDQSQMDVIKRWIDESDIFLLILGGRYGSIESESQKSSTHLEYEYALEKGKALFAVVTDQKALEERVKTSELGFQLIEQDNQHKLKEFRNLVSSKMVRFWSDSKDIKLAILETLSEFSRREELIGWIPGNQAVNTGELAEELARLAKENSELREQINNLSSQLANNQAIFNGLTYEEMYQSLNSLKLDFDAVNLKIIAEKPREILQQISIAFGDSEVSFLHCFWSIRKLFGMPLSYFFYQSIIDPIVEFRLFLFERNSKGQIEYVKLNECGQNFLNCLIKDKKNNLEANKFFLGNENLIDPNWWDK